MSQHQQHVANTDWPQFGRDEFDRHHAIYVITQHIIDLGLTSWLPKILDFLRRFDGFDMRIPDEFDPVVCIKNLLCSHVLNSITLGEKRPVNELKQIIAEDLMGLDFLCYKAAWCVNLVENQRRWNPLDQTWLSFIDSRMPTEEDLSVWDGGTPFTTTETLRAYLLAS